jgi:hypothetical protein
VVAPALVEPGGAGAQLLGGAGVGGVEAVGLEGDEGVGVLVKPPATAAARPACCGWGRRTDSESLR